VIISHSSAVTAAALAAGDATTVNKPAVYAVTAVSAIFFLNVFKDMYFLSISRN
jgi:hypothetical protein